ncbi:ParB N-terminal domain-containing protein [Antarcticirhabdus aurantiaca]|uniref:ParB N-terminal domain-containing protein n=1 Tax=Antarcticirhabdus aurantiaca TaxID=2606717 RepID=A0ACD4NL22_9HYPH|nr:ParB N-terminal domain-containing protein [Jeongeuplla avenae]
MTAVALSDISIDGGTQSRVGLDEQVVADYAAAIRDGADFPPVVLFFDGTTYRLADGFHRFHAYRHAGAVEIEAEVRQGTTRDAILFSVGANASHGLRRSNDDKRKAVLTLLRDAEWSAWSDREIARRVGVSNNFVSSLRPSVIEGQIDAKRTVTRGGTTYQQDTAKIGAPAEDKAAKREARAAQQAEHERQRDEARASLPPAIQEAEAHKQVAIDARAAAPVEGTPAAPLVGLPPEDRIAELEAAVESLTTENAKLKAENKAFAEMRAEFQKGGFAAVIAGKDEVIRAQATRIEAESQEKVRNLRSAEFWRKQAEKLGYSRDVEIDLEEAVDA